MDESAASQQNTKPGWDKRTWLVALIITLVIVFMESAEFERSLQRWINADIANDLAATSCLLALFVFPPIISGFARRRTLLWAYLPILVFIADGIGMSMLPQPPDPLDSSPDPTFRESVMIVAILALSPLISAGPVCLYRVLRRRAKACQVATAAAMHQAMHTTQAGVWPPPPADQGQKP